MNHTKGPWIATVSVGDRNGWDNPKQVVQIEADGGVLIAHYETSYMEYPCDEANKANASLIAAAPELLTALLAMVEEFEGCYADGDPSLVAAKAAIKKATQP